MINCTLCVSLTHVISIMDGISVPSFNGILDSLPTLEKKLDYICNCQCSEEDILHLITAVIPYNCLPLQYLQNLSNRDRTVCYCLGPL